jgi:hypothetical protein
MLLKINWLDESSQLHFFVIGSSNGNDGSSFRPFQLHCRTTTTLVSTYYQATLVSTYYQVVSTYYQEIVVHMLTVPGTHFVNRPPTNDSLHSTFLL